MSDKQSAAILLGLIAVAFILWYRSRSGAQRSALFGTGPSFPESAGDRKVSGKPFPVLPDVRGDNPLDRLLRFAEAWGLTVTSPKIVGGKIIRGRHVEGSAHYQDRAIDVRTKGVAPSLIEEVLNAARMAGFRVIDERLPQRWSEWTGPHLHIEVPR